jgi:hypothetical protein
MPLVLQLAAAAGVCCAGEFSEILLVVPVSLAEDWERLQP